MMVEILVPGQWMGVAIVGRFRQMILLSILTVLVTVNSLGWTDVHKHRCRVIYPQMYVKGSGIGSTRRSRIALLRMKYMDMIDILRWFIKPERARDWAMQVQTIKELPLTCRERQNRTKYIYVYLQAYDGWEEDTKSPGFCSALYALKSMKNFNSSIVEKVTNTKAEVQVNSRETDMTQIRSSNTWKVGNYLR